MRICWPMLFKMFRYTSRCNALLVIVCLGAVIFVWSRCQVGHLELNLKHQQQKSEISTRSVPHAKDSGRDVHDGEEKLDETLNSEEEKAGKVREDEEEFGASDIEEGTKSLPYRNIQVSVNGEKTIEGRVEKKEVYIPFSFIKEYFEIEGKIVRDTFGKKFEWRHTLFEYFTPSTDTYDPRGSFMWFVNYNVEGRSRVKCITGVDEVPVSTQWGPEGYYYPIQIAQYGLSHYSMMKSGARDKKPRVVDDYEKPSNQEWTSGKGASFKKIFDSESKSQVMEFEMQELPDNGVSLSLMSSSKLYFLSFDISFKSAGKITLVLEADDTKQFTIVYETSMELMKVEKKTATYGIGMAKTWRTITRNLLVDLHKAFGEKSKRGKNAEGKKRKLRLTEIQTMTLHGNGYIDNITLAETGHEKAFLASARWLLKNQDKKGGWPIPVKRKIRGGSELEPGWYSAMAQGQAMSVLTRTYYFTKDQRFLDAAEAATQLFHVKSQDNGILAIFMDRYRWYEEYPLTPSLFVLNGFIYSLMGLYDLKMALPAEKRNDAEKLFKEGMVSLRAMILMFDTGSGTIYDLRHLTMSHELNLARWDYHATHVNQLTWITQIDNDPFYKKVLERWKGYFKGLRAKHN